MSKLITQAKLTALLQAVTGAKFATIVTEVPVDMRKTNNPFYGRVTKKSTANVTLNFNYRNSLNKSLSSKVGRAVSADVIHKRTWGERVGKSCFIMHKGQMYLEAKRNAKPSQIIYYIDGVEATANEIKQFNPFIPTKAEPAVPMVNVHVNNIKEVKIDKQHFIVN